MKSQALAPLAFQFDRQVADRKGKKYAENI